MNNITIPPEAVEAAARADYEVTRQDGPDCLPTWEGNPEHIREHYRRHATAAIRAGLAAWPGMFRDYWNGDFSIILPLPPPPKENE